MPKNCAVFKAQQASSTLRQHRSRPALPNSLAAASQPCLPQSSYVTLAALSQLRWDPTQFYQIFSITWLSKQVRCTKTSAVTPCLWVVSVMATFLSGVPAEAQLLICCAIQLQAGPVLPQIPAGCTVSLLGRLRGGSSTVNITLQPRVQKDKWSMYWKESMATKTEALDSIALAVDDSIKVSVLQQVCFQRLC